MTYVYYYRRRGIRGVEVFSILCARVICMTKEKDSHFYFQHFLKTFLRSNLSLNEQPGYYHEQNLLTNFLILFK